MNDLTIKTAEIVEVYPTSIWIESADALLEADEGVPDAIRDRDDSRTCAALLESHANLAERLARSPATQNQETHHD